jgi:hypothetical protein
MLDINIFLESFYVHMQRRILMYAARDNFTFFALECISYVLARTSMHGSGLIIIILILQELEQQE